MENPASWGELEKLIHATIQDHHKAMADGIIGYSLPAKLAIVIREAGYKKD